MCNLILALKNAYSLPSPVKVRERLGPKQKYQEESHNEMTEKRLHVKVLKCVNTLKNKQNKT